MAAQPADPDDREATVVGDPDLGRLGHQPRFVQIQPGVPQFGGVQLAGRSDAVANILVDLAQRRTSEQSATFAGLIVREGDGVLKFHPDPRRSADFVVLRAPDVPSVLYEAGFISNPDDAERLTSPAGQQRFATVMAHAIRIYFARQAGV